MKIFVTAYANARVDLVEKIDETHFKVSTKELPIKFRANLAIIELLADYFKIPKTDIQISAGLANKQKVLEISK